jgi:hypothetical protein
LLTSLSQPVSIAAGRNYCQNVCVADNTSQKSRYIDNGWPELGGDDDHAVSELATDRTGASSPFGDITFPVPAEDLPYTHPITVVNK